MTVPTAVLVTGASAGIGRAAALEYAARGRPVALLARRRERLEAIADSIRDSGGTASIHVCDVGDRASLRKAVAAAEAALGPLGTCVANAGFGYLGPLATMGDEDVDRMLRVNLAGAIDTVRAVLPGMIRRRRGRIALVSSVLGKVSVPACALYCATKWALVGFARALRPEVAPFGVTVTTICPGRTSSEFFDVWKVRTVLGWMNRRPQMSHTPEAVARALVAATEAGRREATVGFANRLVVAALSLCPGTSERLLGRAVAKDVAESTLRDLR